MEGIWAPECGVPAAVRRRAGDHGRFFNSKERRAALAETPLPKTSEAPCAWRCSPRARGPRPTPRATPCATSCEAARGSGAADRARPARPSAECGLAATLWSAVRDVWATRARRRGARRRGPALKICSPLRDLWYTTAPPEADAARILAARANSHTAEPTTRWHASI